MAYCHVGLYAEFFEKAVHGDVGRKHSRLGKLGLLYGGFAFGQVFLALARLAPDGVCQAHAYHFLQYNVRFVEGCLHHLVLGRKVPHHIHVLRALAGEQQAHFGFIGACFKGVNAFQLKIKRRGGPGLVLGVFSQKVRFLHQVLG